MKYLTLLTLIFLINQAQAQLPTYAPTSNLEGFYSFSGNVLDNSGNGLINSAKEGIYRFEVLFLCDDLSHSTL
ncbi:MAG: hypothetical protein Crog4KO_16990 [Crocinitomicaceae bacterium]